MLPVDYSRVTEASRIVERLELQRDKYGHMFEFVPNTIGLKIKGRGGNLCDFGGIAHIGDRPTVAVTFTNGKSLECSVNHRFMTPQGRVEVADLHQGSRVFRGDGRTTKVKSILETGRTVPVYDIIEVRDGHEFVANGVLNSNCKFVTDEETLIDPLCLSRLRSINPAFYTKTVRWYIEPLPNRTYLVALDPCMGTGGDYAAVQVFMLPELIQVAEWQHNTSDPRTQVRTLLEMLHTLSAELAENPEQQGEPTIFWTVENNSIGDTILHIIEDTGEDKFPGVIVNEKKRRGQRRRFRKGMTTTNTTKLSSCARLKSLIESDRMIINSQQALKELKSFVARGQSYAAKPGTHDDLVSALLLIVRMLDQVIAMGETDGGDLKDGVDMEELFKDPMPIVV
jgi:hypothetical protein